jgi:hypothetical protein
MAVRMPLHSELLIGFFDISSRCSFGYSESLIVVFFHTKMVSNYHQNARGAKLLTNKIYFYNTHTMLHDTSDILELDDLSSVAVVDFSRAPEVELHRKALHKN